MQNLTVKPAVVWPVVVWDFISPPVADKQTFNTDFSLAEDLTRRANRAVAGGSPRHWHFP